jgi:hypothetical protein
VTTPGGAGTSSKNFFIPHQATTAGPMLKIVSSVILFSHFSSKMLSYKLSITSQLSHLSPFFVLPDSPLAGSTLYTLPPVTLSEFSKS